MLRKVVFLLPAIRSLKMVHIRLPVMNGFVQKVLIPGAIQGVSVIQSSNILDIPGWCFRA